MRNLESFFLFQAVKDLWLFIYLFVIFIIFVILRIKRKWHLWYDNNDKKQISRLIQLVPLINNILENKWFNSIKLQESCVRALNFLKLRNSIWMGNESLSCNVTEKYVIFMLLKLNRNLFLQMHTLETWAF